MVEKLSILCNAIKCLRFQKSCCQIHILFITFLKPLSSFIVLLRTPFYIKVFKLMILNILNLSCCFFFTAAFRTTTITITNFTSNNVSNKVYIMLTICTTFFSRQRKEKLRFWKLFGIKVSFLKSFSYVSFIYTGSGHAKIIHNRKN